MELKQQLGTDYATKLKVIENKTKGIWEKGELYHTYYTLHGMKHSDAVINILDLLVAGLNPEDQLEEIEVFCLLSAAYLHDVGMQHKYPDDEARIESISKSKNEPYTFQDLIRDEHHLRSGRYIKENLKILDLDQYEAECVRLISEGHRKVNLHSDDYESRAIGFKRIRVRLLSSLLRLADELDIDYKRAPEILYEILKEDMPYFSKLQWLKHYYTTGLIIDPIIKESKRRLSIEINCQYPREDEGRKITEILILKPIEEKTEELKTIFLECGLKIDLTYKLKLNTDLSEIPEYLYKDDFGQNLKVSIELPRTKGFVGRDDKLNELLNSLDRNIIVIEGIPGIGKTYISAKFAEKLKDRFDVYWYGNLSEVSTLSSVLKKFAYFLKGKNKPRLANSIEHFGYDNDVLIALLKEELNSSNFAIFLDDYHKAEKELNPLLRELLSIEKSKIIVITRHEPKFYNSVDTLEKRVTTVKIDSWNPENTRMMLEARGIETSESVSREIHERLHGHPQYLNLFCTLALNDTAEELLRNVPKALKEAYDYLETEVYNSLSSNEKILLQTIAIFRVPETIEAFDSINESKDLSETLDELINKLLVNEIGSNTFKVHDIIRDYCLGDPKKKALRRYHENAAKYYLSLNDEPENILESSYHFEKASLSERSFEILIMNANNFISKGFWDKIEVQLKNSIKYFQRKTHPNIINLVAGAHYSIGMLYETKEEYDLALKHAVQCQLLFNRTKNGKNINLIKIYNLLSSIYSHKGDIEKATEYSEKCFQMAESQGDNIDKAIAIANRANLLKNEDKELCFKYQIEALEIFKNYGALEQLASAHVNIALDYSARENFEKAYEHIKKALEIQKERNALYGIANTKFKIATIYFQDPEKPINYDQIIECLEGILDTYEKIGHKRGVAEVRYLIGEIYIKNKDLELAMENFQDALELCEKIGDKERIEKTLTSIGYIYVKTKNFEPGVEIFRKAYDLYSSLNQEASRANLGISLAEVLLLAGNPKEALDVVYEITELNSGKNSLDNRVQALALFFAATSSSMLNEVNRSSQFLQKIGNLDNKEFSVNWDFSDIEPVLIKMGESKQLFLDVIAFLKGETSFPILRLEDIQILEEEGMKSNVYHPFAGCLTISATDTDLEKLIKQIDQSQTINFDMSNILDLERKKALLMLGFLSKKGIYEIQCLEDQKYKLELTKKGSRLLKSILVSEQ
ncbi:tetratricopeptide repeat protein [Methanosarcina sp. Z-7115]|uniref:Tetratricopeptide repeat protein n=1 Tax=Methanosarcina baikalica TaxID=3073890 RepID=A0ABU2CXC4_9EURY|nr:tetratricopeptide repeat protein [Methanosarcina sp. Z-7115]MDR7664390.1 tetratricopeptide repeat protein [Methanosarcina sp. Z-7115]